MQFLIVLVFALIVASIIYRMGRRAGYDAGRVEEREEWKTKIRELDD
jgi:hypothetical protein